MSTTTFAVLDATIEARRRTRDQAISTRVRKGALQVVRVTFDAKGKGTVTEVSDWRPIDEIVSYLNGMGSAR